MAYVSYPWQKPGVDLTKIDDAQMDAWRIDGSALHAQTELELKAKAEKVKSAITLLREAGVPSRVESYIKKHAPSYYLTEFNSVWRDLLKRREDALKKIETAKRDAEAAQAADSLQAEAIIWLQDRGKKLGDDFLPSSAVGIADEIAYEEAVNQRLSGMAGALTGFNGQNCDGPCGGWDGKSRRCECGNRRVYWERDYGHSFKSPSIHGEAY